MKKKLLSIFLVLAMALCLAPTAVFAIGMQSNTTGITVNSTKVAFAGHEWWVIGDGTNGVYPQSDHITLLAANLDSDFQNVPFRRGQSAEFTGSSRYSGNGWYYANNPESVEAWTTPNEYAGSTLQQKMEKLANDFPENERNVISARSLTGGGTYQSPRTDGIAGQGVANQKLWALSEAELDTINDTSVRSYGDWWWLRSPSPDDGYVSRMGYTSGDLVLTGHVDDAFYAARPALSLNLSSVLFTSAAEGGKSSATVGSNLVGASAPTGTVKFTMVDDSQKLTVNATTAQSTQTGEALSFSYSDATTGSYQYISCILTDSSGAVKYYGKLADSSGTASGNLSVPLAGVADGTYTLKIFSEQANWDLYTDFCSEPVSMKVAVTGGKGTVSEFGGTLIHEHSWSDEWQKNETHHWHDCTAANCPITDNSKKEGYAEHSKIIKIDKKDATCTETGYSAVIEICNTCDRVLSVNRTITARLKHNITHHPASTGTCTAKGNIEYYSCSGCGKNFSDENGNNEITNVETEKNAENHSGTAVWTQTATTHKQVYSCCQVVNVAETNHAWQDGKCTVCNYVCQHTDTDKNHICDICGKTISDHRGGTATCTAKAVCVVCNEEYGDLAPHELTHIDAKDATAAEFGNTEYWYCRVCDRYFSDENAENEIEPTDTVISKLAPKIIAGDGATVTESEKTALSFASDAAFDDFIRVEIDGVTLYEANYTVKEGSTVVTLNADYVVTLSVGEHTLGIVSESGTAAAKFTVNKKAEETTAETTTTPSNEAETEKTVKADNKTSPLTGGGNNLALWLTILLISGGTVGTTVVSRKKKQEHS